MRRADDGIGNAAADYRLPMIPVAVVESHQHALEHVHSVLRWRARVQSRRRRIERLQQQQQQQQQKCQRLGPPPTQDSEHQPDQPPLQLAPLTMVHLDSHPDLACPSPDVPAGACFEPRREWERGSSRHRGAVEEEEKGDADRTGAMGGGAARNLYEFLDLDRSGIAQWILPLVVTGDVGTVRWVRSSWADQFRDGTYAFNVGAWVPPPPTSSRKVEGTSPPPPPWPRPLLDSIESFVDLPPAASVKVDLQHPYYYDDDSVVSTEELMLPRRLHLIVSELPTATIECDVPGDLDDTCSKSEDSDWILDICLDYFACRNPFIDEIEGVDAAFSRALQDAVKLTRFHMDDFVPSDGAYSCSYLHDSRAFHRIMMKLLGANSTSEITCSSEADAGSPQGIITGNRELSVEEYEELFSLYSSPQTGEDVVGNLERALKNSDSKAKLAALAIDALPSIILPQDSSSLDNASCQADMLASALERVKLVGDALKVVQFGFCRPPIAITIARSTNDGFTPSTVVDHLQHAVLGVVHGVFCGCKEGADGFVRTAVTGKGNIEPDSLADACNLRLLFDYGKWEGSSFEL